MRSEDLRCQDVVDLLTDYLDHALPAEQRAALEEHLLACEGCTNILAQLRVSIELTGRLREDDIPPELMETVLEVLEKRAT